MGGGGGGEAGERSVSTTRVCALVLGAQAIRHAAVCHNTIEP